MFTPIEGPVLCPGNSRSISLGLGSPRVVPPPITHKATGSVRGIMVSSGKQLCWHSTPKVYLLNTGSVFLDVLHSIRSLLSTATNETPRDRFLCFQRRSATGRAVPTWLTTPGPVLLWRFVRQSKSDPLVDEVELVEPNAHYAHIRFQNGCEDTVSMRDLAPINRELTIEQVADHIPATEGSSAVEEPIVGPEDVQPPAVQAPTSGPSQSLSSESDWPPLRRSKRERRPPTRNGFED